MIFFFGAEFGFEFDKQSSKGALKALSFNGIVSAQ
jgi:hypothetical protein